MKNIKVQGYSGLIEGPAGDLIVESYKKHKQWSLDSIKIIEDCFKSHGDEGTYFDIGANIGLTAIPFIRMPKVNVICFEPDSDNFELLKKNVEGNCGIYHNYVLHKKGVYNRTGRINFEHDKGNCGNYYVDEKGSRSIQVDLLDRYVSAINKKPLCIKIDVQGSEWKAIIGGKKVISQADVFILEYWPHRLDYLGCDIDQFLEFLGDNFKKAGHTIKISQGHKTVGIKTVLAEMKRKYKPANIGAFYDYAFFA